MAISKTEAALYGYITGKTVPKGTTRKVFRTLVSGIIGAGRALAPPVARGSGRALLGLGRGLAGLTLPGKVGLGALTLYEAQQMGLLDEPIARGRAAAIEGFERGFDYLPQRMPEQYLEDFQGLDVGPAPTKKKVTKYNRAVRAGMGVVKASQYFGKKGTINNPKKAFVTVNRTASKVNKGKKVSTKGAIGKIARAVRRILK